MVSIKVTNNTQRQTVIKSVDATLQEVLEEAKVNVDTATLRLEGSPVTIEDFGKTLAELGIKDESDANLVSIIKATSAK